MISKGAIHMCNVCKTFLKKKPLICAILKKALNVYFVIKTLKKSRLYVQFVGKDLKNMYQVAQKVQSERNWHHVRLGSTYTVT